MSTLTQSQVDQQLATDDDTVHLVCCDPDVALCGDVVSNHGWTATDTETDCYLCAVAEANDLPCGDPNCPDREVTL